MRGRGSPLPKGRPLLTYELTSSRPDKWLISGKCNGIGDASAAKVTSASAIRTRNPLSQMGRVMVETVSFRRLIQSGCRRRSSQWQRSVVFQEESRGCYDLPVAE